jgi:hypothetical protein
MLQVTISAYEEAAANEEMSAAEIGEAEHFDLCPACGQAVDMRDHSAVLHHERNGHKPMRRN